MRIANGSCVLVVDGRKLLFLRNAGDAEHPALKVETARNDVNPADHDQKTDRSGSAPSGGSPGGATMGETDFHQQEEDRFAASAAALINRRALAGDSNR